MLSDAPPASRAHQGASNYRNGLSAEDAVAAHYTENGARCLARRWRGQSGEIDLIFEDDDSIVIIEVKRATSFEQAALHLNERQMQRIYEAADEFVGGLDQGSLTPIRVDAALVDETGRIEIVENISLL